MIWVEIAIDYLNNYLETICENQIKYYTCQIILALEELHQMNIIYRDLKPENVVIDSDGYALLTDFGLAKFGVEGQVDGARSFCGLPCSWNA